MFKGLRQKIGQGLASTSARGVAPHALQEGSPRLPPTSESQQNVSPGNPVSEDTPVASPSGSLINLNDEESTNTSLQQAQTDSLIDLSTHLSGPAVLDISGSGSHVADFKSPRDRTTRSRTSSVSSQASDSFFTPVGTFVSRQFPLPSDVESITSEAEDGGVALDNISKEELYRCYCQMQQRSTKYRWKFSQVLKTYQEMENERDKLRDTMTKSQDKAFRRISELKEQIHLDQLAKVDLEQNYALMLEEKDEVIKVLRTQITLLKQGKEVPDEMLQKVEDGTKGAKTDSNNISDNQSETVLKEKIARMSSLLLASKESISKNREQVQKLSAKNVRLMESLEITRTEKERLQADVQKKDEDFATLVEKLKSEILKLSNGQNEGDSKVLDLTDSTSCDQIEHLHRKLLTLFAKNQMQCQISQEQLIVKDTENQKLHSENKLLMEEIAEQKRALKESLQCGIYEDEQCNSASLAVEQKVCLCPKHRASLMCNVLSLGESIRVGEEIVANFGVTESNQASELVEHGAGEFVQHQDFVCVVCEKEGQLALANEKIHSCHERISHLEAEVNKLRLECEPRIRCADETDQAENESNREADCDERDRTALKRMEESHSLEMTGLKEKIESLQNQLQEVTDAHQSQIDVAERQHQMEIEELRRSFDTESEQMNLSLSKELENLKEEVTNLERELTRQQEANELSERSSEVLRMEIDSERHSFESRLSTILEEKQNLAKELQTADEWHQLVSAALQDVQNLKASLSTTVQDIAQEARDPTANMESQTDEVRQKQVECDLDSKGDGEEGLAVIHRQAEGGDILTENRMEEGDLRATAQIVDLQNKNDSLHLLLHDWQGCLQMLKNCLKDKQVQNQLLKTNLQDAQLTVEKLRAQLIEEDEKWQAKMEKVKELLKQELNDMEEEMKNRLITKETELAGNDEKWQARMDEVKELHKEELNHLQEEIKNRLITKGTELASSDEKWQARMDEVKELHKEELNHLQEEIKNRLITKETELASSDEKWQARMDEVKELHKEELNHLQEEIKNRLITKETELASSDEKWQARMDEVKELHKEELSHLQEEIKNRLITKETELASSDEKWQARMDEVKELHKEELSHLQEEIKNRLITKETELASSDEKWQARMDEVKELHKEELSHLQEEIKNRLITKETELASSDEKWQARMDKVKELHKEELNHLQEEIKNLITTKETELAGNDEKWKAKLEEVTMLHNEELNCFEEEFKKLIAERGVKFAVGDRKWKANFEEVEKLHKEELGRLAEEAKTLISTKDRELADLETTYKEQKEVSEIEIKKLRNNCVLMEDKNMQLSDQLSVAEKQIENLLMTMHDLKNLRDTEEESLRRSLQEAMEMGEKSVESRIQLLSDQKNVLQKQLQDMKQEFQAQLEILRSRNEALASELQTFKLQKDNLSQQVGELEQMNQELKMQHDLRESELKFLQEQLTELKVRMAEVTEGEKSLADKLWLTEEQCKAAENQIDKLRNQEAMLENKIQELLIQKDSCEMKSQKLHDENEKLKNELKNLKEQGKSSTKLQKALKMLKDKNESLSQQVKELEEQRTSIEAELKETKEQTGSVLEQLKELEEQRGSMEKNLQEVKDENGSLIEKVKDLEQQRSELYQELVEFKGKNGSLHEQVKELEKQREVSQKELQEHKDQIGSLCEQLKEAEEQKESTCRNVKELEEQFECMRKELLDFKDQNELLKVQLEDNETKKKSALQEMVQHKSKILEEADILRTQVTELNSLRTTLENQLKQSEADSVSLKTELEEELEKRKAEAVMLKEVVQQQEEKVRELQDLAEVLSNEKMQKDYEVKEVKEMLANAETSYTEKLFELRKNLCVLIGNQEMSSVSVTKDPAEEIAALEKVVETELSSYLLGLHTQLDTFGRQSDNATSKAAELVEQLNAAEKKRYEEEATQSAERSALEVQNGELRIQVEKLNSFVNELQEQANSFVKTQAICDKTFSEKDLLLHEAEEKLKVVTQEADSKQMRLLAVFEELQEKVAMLSNQNADSEKIASVYKEQSQASEHRLSELTELLTESKNRLQETEAQIETLSAENEAERMRLMATIQELSNQNAEGARISKENAELMKSMEERLKCDADKHEKQFRNLKLDFDAVQEKLSTKTEQIIEFENTLAKKDFLLKELEENLRTKVSESDNEIELLRTNVLKLEDLLINAASDMQDTIRKKNENLAFKMDEKLKDCEAVHKMKVEQLESMISSHENRIHALTESLLDVEKIKEMLEGAVEQLKLQNAEQLENICAERDDALKKLKVAYSECKNKDDVVSDLRKINEERDKILSELQEKVTVKEQEIEKLQQQLSDLEGKVQIGLAGEELIRERERLIDELQEKVKIVSERHKSEIDRLKSENEDQRNEMSTVIAENEFNKSELERLKVENEEQKKKANAVQIKNEELEEKLLERSELEAKKGEEHCKEMEATETCYREKIKDLQRKFVIKLKAVQNEHDKALNEVNTEIEELRLSKSALETRLENLQKIADQHLSAADELKVKLSELEKNQADAVQKTLEVVVEKHQEDLKEKSYEVLQVEQSRGEQTVKSQQDAEEPSGQEQILEVSGYDANGEKEEQVEIKGQLKQALDGENEAQLKLEKSGEFCTELKQSIDVLKREIDELKVKNEEELRLQAVRLETECSDKLAELKKKAEIRLKHIKNQIQTEKDSSIAELIQVGDDLREQLSVAKRELSCHTELLREKEDEIQRLNMMLKNTEDKQMEETCSLRNESEASKQQLLEDLHAKENILEELKGRHQSLEEEAARLRQTIQSMEEEGHQQSDKLASLETKCKGLKKQLVSAKHEIDRIKSEKDSELRAAQLDKEKEVTRLMSEYKEQLKDTEIDNNSRIKQLVKEFQLKLAEKENEFQSTYMEALEKSQREEDIMIHQHKQEMKSMRLELKEKEESFEESIQQLEVQLQAAELQLEEERKSCAEIELLKQNVERLENELLECQRANVTISNEQCDTDEPAPEKMSLMNPLGAPVPDSSTYINEQLQQDVINLTRQIEELKIRYSLQVIKDQAQGDTEMTTVQGIETTDGSQLSSERHQIQTLELHNMDLQAQVVQQSGDIARLKIRERALQHDVEVLHGQLSSKTSEIESLPNEVPSAAQAQTYLPTELQYLKNVLLKFMTGTEQQTLARVICTVLKFSEEETQAVMDHLYSEMF